MSRATSRWCSSATASRWAVGRASPVALHQLGQGRRTGLQGAQHDSGLVENADSARLVHALDTAVSHVRRKQVGQHGSRRIDRRVTTGDRRDGAHAGREGLGRPPRARRARTASPTSSTSTCTSCTRSPARRPSTACGWPAARSAAPTSRSRPRTTTPRPSTSTSRSPTSTSRTQIETLRRNGAEFGVRLHSLGDVEQGIVHVVGPQLGLTQPGITVVCGDSHTSTHGAFGAMAFGIGTSEVEHVLATQTLPLKPFKTMAITVEGDAARGRHRQGHHPRRHRARSAPAAARATCSSTAASAIRALSMEGRMTICNMSIEAGARAGHGRAGRDHVRLPRGPPARAAGRGLGRRRRVLAHAAHRRRRGLRRRGRPRRRRARAVRHLGHQPRPGRAAVGDACPTRHDRRPERRAAPPSARSSTWTSRRARR